MCDSKCDNKLISDTALFESAMDREERHIKRLTWIIVFMIACWITTVGVFVWYISLPVEETVTTQTVDDIDSSNIKQIVGAAAAYPILILGKKSDNRPPHIQLRKEETSFGYI